MTRAYVVGTFDTKGDELRYVGEVIRAAGVEAVLVDVGTTGKGHANVSAAEVARHHPEGEGAVWSDDRGSAVAAMSVALVRFVEAHTDDIGGMIGAAGSGGTALVTPAMRGNA